MTAEVVGSGHQLENALVQLQEPHVALGQIGAASDHMRGAVRCYRLEGGHVSVVPQEQAISGGETDASGRHGNAGDFHKAPVLGLDLVFQ